MTQNVLATQAREKNIVAASSVAAAIFLTIMKLVVGFLTGSLGILAEAAHSGLDLVAAIITLLAVRVSDRPADDSHLYGHGKVENLSALAETMLLLLTCVWIVYEAIRRLFFESVEVDPSAWAFITMGISIVVDFSRSRALRRIAKKYHSQALEADALHFSTDIWSSLVVITGLVMVRYGQATGNASFFVRADAMAALGVAIIVIYVSLQLGGRTIDALIDRAPKGMAERISSAVAGVRSVRGVTRTRVRAVGNQVFVDMSVSVPRQLSFEESHEVTQQVQAAVRSISPRADVVVHAVPDGQNEGVLERIQATAARKHLAIHNITTHWTQRGIWIDLDVEVDRDLNFERAHAIATELETELRFQLSDGKTEVADVNAHIEPREEPLITGQEISPIESDEYVRQIERISSELPYTRGCQDIAVHKIEGRVYLSFHLLVDANRPIAEVHEIAEELENRLRLRFTQLGRVMIHTEPYSSE